MTITTNWNNGDRTGKPAEAVYTFVGLAEIRADYREPRDFMVETATEPHADGTVRIVEARIDGEAFVWGESSDGTQIWGRRNDAIARAAIEMWDRDDGVAKAREMTRAFVASCKHEGYFAGGLCPDCNEVVP